MAGKHEILSDHFYAVDRESNLFKKPTAADIDYLLEKRPFLQVVGVTLDKGEDPDLSPEDEADLSQLQALEDNPDATPPEPETPEQPQDFNDLSDEQQGQVMDFLSSVDEAAEQDTFSDFIDSGYYGEPALIELASGWIVHYWPQTEEYPPAMCISAGEEIIPSAVKDSKKPEDDHGTIVGQAFDAAAQVVLIALAKKWQAIQVVSGTDLMRWATWAVAVKNKLECFGYDADSSDTAKAERVADIIEDKYSHKPTVVNIPTLTPGGNLNAGAAATDDVEEDDSDKSGSDTPGSDTSGSDTSGSDKLAATDSESAKDDAKQDKSSGETKDSGDESSS